MKSIKKAVQLSILATFWVLFLPLRVLFFLVGLIIAIPVAALKWARNESIYSERRFIRDSFIDIFAKISFLPE